MHTLCSNIMSRRETAKKLFSLLEKEAFSRNFSSMPQINESSRLPKTVIDVSTLRLILPSTDASFSA